MKKTDEELVYRTSRISYLHNYIIVALVLIVLYIIYPMLDIFGNLLHLALFFGVLSIAAGFAEEPEWHILFTKYIITNNEIVKLHGILNKKKIVIPYQSVSDVMFEKSVLGRILNYGSVYVRGFKEGGDIELKGVRNPEEVHNIIQNKINLMRETTLKAWKK